MSNIQLIFDLPRVNSLRDLANKIKLSEYLLYNLTSNTECFYRIVEKPKANGEIRMLACPSKKLKAVQAWILRNILQQIPLEKAATAFIKGTNIKLNAERHKENSFIVCLDIKGFFDNIPRSWVYNLFRSLGYNRNVSMIFTNICTFEGHLPQGGVTSPCLSNILCKRLDRRISGYVGKRNISYSRYADDITLSGNNPAVLLKSVEFIKKIINDEGFTINERKSRVMRSGYKKHITGLIISDAKTVGIGRRRIMYLRAAIYHLETSNYEKWDDHKRLRAHINGWMSYIRGIDEKAYSKLDNYWKEINQKLSHKQAAAEINPF